MWSICSRCREPQQRPVSGSLKVHRPRSRNQICRRTAAGTARVIVAGRRRPLGPPSPNPSASLRCCAREPPRRPVTPIRRPRSRFCAEVVRQPAAPSSLEATGWPRCCAEVVPPPRSAGPGRRPRRSCAEVEDPTEPHHAPVVARASRSTGLPVECVRRCDSAPGMVEAAGSAGSQPPCSALSSRCTGASVGCNSAELVHAAGPAWSQPPGSATPCKNNVPSREITGPGFGGTDRDLAGFLYKYTGQSPGGM